MANLAVQHRYQRASDLELARNEPQLLPLVIRGIPLWNKGLARGSIAELSGRRSSGRTACLQHVLAQATQNGEICAVVDTHNQFDPASAGRNGVLLDRLLWIRCNGKVEHAIRVTDLLLHAGGFGVVALDLCETIPKQLNKIPLSYWFRFRRAIQSTSAILLVSAEDNQAKSSAMNVLKLDTKVSHWIGPACSRLFLNLRVTASLKKPAFHPSGHFTLAS